MSTINISGGISKKLKTLFPSYTVYTEDQSQGTDQEDAFYILHSLSISPDVSGRVWLHALVTIRAACSSSVKNAEKSTENVTMRSFPTISY